MVQLKNTSYDGISDMKLLYHHHDHRDIESGEILEFTNKEIENIQKAV